MTVFFREGDYWLYKSLLRERVGAAGVSIRAYCLMPNHVHLILVPERADSLAQLFRSVHAHYAELVNARRSWTGHLWQQRFASFPLHESHLQTVLHYVHENPVRAGIVERAEQWPWSSARCALGLEVDDLVDPCSRQARPEATDVARRPTAADFETIRAAARTGRPIGPTGFVRELEQLLGRPLLPRRRGPKPKNATGSPEDPDPGITGFGELSPN